MATKFSIADKEWLERNWKGYGSVTAWAIIPGTRRLDRDRAPYTFVKSPTAAMDFTARCYVEAFMESLANGHWFRADDGSIRARGDHYLRAVPGARMGVATLFVNDVPVGLVYRDRTLAELIKKEEL